MRTARLVHSFTSLWSSSSNMHRSVPPATFTEPVDFTHWRWGSRFYKNKISVDLKTHNRNIIIQFWHTYYLYQIVSVSCHLDIALSHNFSFDYLGLICSTFIAVWITWKEVSFYNGGLQGKCFLDHQAWPLRGWTLAPYPGSLISSRGEQFACLLQSSNIPQLTQTQL